MKNRFLFPLLLPLIQLSCSEAPIANNAANAARNMAIAARNEAPSYQPPPPPTPQKHSIVNKTFHVEASNYVWYATEFPVQTRLTGRFSAQGGKNDIACWVVDEDNFINLKNNTALLRYYESGYTTRGKVDVVVPAGIYYVVFDNRAALFTNKTVTAEFEAEYLSQ